jgi:hypothetical protein
MNFENYTDWLWIHPLATVSYIDTIRLRSKARPSEAFARRLRQHALSICIENRPIPYMPNFDTRISLQKPDEKAFSLIEPLFKNKGAFFSQLDLALDMIATTREQADAMQEFWRRYAFQRWSREEPRRFKTTDYSQSRRWGRTILACYADRPSKVCGRPCLHAEIRVTGKGRLAAVLGVRRAGDLLTLDHAKVWERLIGFEECDLLRLARQVSGRSKAKDGSDVDRRSANVIRRAVAEEDIGTVSTARVRRLARSSGITSTTAFNRIDLFEQMPWPPATDLGLNYPDSPHTRVNIEQNTSYQGQN